jgi:uncharacterized protein (UPF0333 family)
MKRDDGKGQISTEYLVIIGIVLIFMIPIALVYIKYSGEGSQSVLINKVDGMSDDLKVAIEGVYSYGEESETSVFLKIPKGVSNITFADGEIIFNIKMLKGMDDEIVKTVSAKMAYCFIGNPSQGTHKITLKKVYEQTRGEIISFTVDDKGC